ELRELLDQDAVGELELQLQHLTRERAARHADGLHEMLLRLGDLTRDEIVARSADPAAADDWIATLVRERRVLDVRIGNDTRFIAAEDAGRYRDALGIALPLGLPEAFLASDEPDPLASLVRRYARTHGPFAGEDVSRRFSVAPTPVHDALRRLAEAGTIVEGQFRPGATATEWCDAGVLRTLRGRSLARRRPLGSRLGGRGHQRHVPRGPRAPDAAAPVAGRRSERGTRGASAQPRSVRAPRRRRRALVPHLRGRRCPGHDDRARDRADPPGPRAARRGDSRDRAR